MRTFSLGFLMLFAAAAPAQEPAAKSKIVAAGLFKNGLAVIQREVVLPGPGTHRLEDLPEPVHGTWWIESKAAVETTVKTKEVEVPAGGNVHFQNDLAGRKVTVHFRDGKPDPVSGIVLKVARPKEEVISGEAAAAPAETGRFLVLKTAKGRMFIDPAQIAILDADGADEPVRKEKRSVLFLSAPKAQANDKVMITYLTHGLAWAPSYRVDISDPKNPKEEKS